MVWFWTLSAIIAAVAAGLAFRLTLDWPPYGRKVAWFIATFLAAISPCIVPLSAPLFRLGATLVAIAIMVKLYDVSRNPSLAKNRGPFGYAHYLVNVFWLALPLTPAPMPASVDVKQLSVALPIGILMIGTCALVFSFNYSQSSFIFEHSLKVATLALTLIPLADGAASAWRLSGGRGLDPMHNLATAPTPAQFWRRWNRPVQQFFHFYVFDRTGGRRRPVVGILATFLISGIVHEYVFGITVGRMQGWQLLFFATNGVAVAATYRYRFRGPLMPIAVVATILFNLLVSVFFFKSVAAVVPFYSDRN